MPYSNIMCVEARHINGGTVNALNMTRDESDALQRTYTVGVEIINGQIQQVRMMA